MRARTSEKFLCTVFLLLLLFFSFCVLARTRIPTSRKKRTTTVPVATRTVSTENPYRGKPVRTRTRKRQRANDVPPSPGNVRVTRARARRVEFIKKNPFRRTAEKTTDNTRVFPRHRRTLRTKEMDVSSVLPNKSIIHLVVSRDNAYSLLERRSVDARIIQTEVHNNRVDQRTLFNNNQP